MAINRSASGNIPSASTTGTPITTGITRLSANNVNIPLAKFSSITKWNPCVGDFILWHGLFWRRWCGVVNAIYSDHVTIITDGLPKLLFTMPESDYNKNTISVLISSIRSSYGGEYHILQNGVWYFD